MDELATTEREVKRLLDLASAAAQGHGLAFVGFLLYVESPHVRYEPFSSSQFLTSQQFIEIVARASLDMTQSESERKAAT